MVDRAPGAARAGVGLVAVPAIYFFVLLGWELLAFLLGLSSLMAMIPRPDIVTEVLILLFAVGAILFGAVDLRDVALSPTVGYLLVLFAAGWLLFLAAIPVYGFPPGLGRPNPNRHGDRGPPGHRLHPPVRDPVSKSGGAGSRRGPLTVQKG